MFFIACWWLVLFISDILFSIRLSTILLTTLLSCMAVCSIKSGVLNSNLNLKGASFGLVIIISPELAEVNQVEQISMTEEDSLSSAIINLSVLLSYPKSYTTDSIILPFAVL
jgi:hypothetical protein